jgi:hypothetical protein
MLKECRSNPFLLATIDEDLWRQCEVSLVDCKATLAQLELLLSKIMVPAKRTSLFRGAKVAVDLTRYASDLAGFQEKLNKSNLGLQTMLSVVKVLVPSSRNAFDSRIIC